MESGERADKKIQTKLPTEQNRTEKEAENEKQKTRSEKQEAGKYA